MPLSAAALLGISVGASTISQLLNNSKVLSWPFAKIEDLRKLEANLYELGRQAEVAQTRMDQLSGIVLIYSPQLANSWNEWVRKITAVLYDIEDITYSLEIDTNRMSHPPPSKMRRLINVLTMGLHGHNNNDSGGKQRDENVASKAKKITPTSKTMFKLEDKVLYLKEELQRIEQQLESLMNGRNKAQIIDKREKEQIITNQKRLYPKTALPLPRGRQTDMEKVINLLKSDNVGVAIIGMAGLGKTTLARSIVDNQSMRDHFHAIMWANVSEGLENVNVLTVYKHDHFKDTKKKTNEEFTNCLVVLDDLKDFSSNVMCWEKFKSNKIPQITTMLITTRDPRAAHYTQTHLFALKRLSDEDCGELMKNYVYKELSFSDKKYFNSYASYIAKKSLGLPLVATILGILLRAKYKVLGSDAISYFAQTDMWEVHKYQILHELGLLDPRIVPTFSNKLLAYFNLFPQGYEFSRDELLQLWIGEGFIKPENHDYWKEQADKMFDDMLPMSMVEPMTVNNAEDNHVPPYYQINEITHRLAGSYPSNFCLRRDTGLHSSPALKDSRHLSFCYKNIQEVNLADAAKQYKRLRTILLLNKERSNLGEVPPLLFQKLSFLRVLNLSHSYVSVIPYSICMLQHLGYLDISDTAIETLPESLCTLLCMRILKLRKCSHLKHLPYKIGKRVKLIHLDLTLTTLSCTPPNLGKLTNLQTLNAFTVKNQKGHGITELGSMDALQGEIKIMELENVENKTKAAEARLHKKRCLKSLVLEWTESSMPEPSVTKDILTELRPDMALKKLSLISYSGVDLPSWIYDPRRCLQSIRIYNSPNITKLPPLWKLPLLKTLRIESMPKLQHIGRDFLGDLNADRFFSLEYLEFYDMEQLVSWEEIAAGDFRSLMRLNLSKCPKLTGLRKLSNVSSLQCLEITRCPKLNSLKDELPTSVCINVSL